MFVLPPAAAQLFQAALVGAVERGGTDESAGPGIESLRRPAAGVQNIRQRPPEIRHAPQLGRRCHCGEPHPKIQVFCRAWQPVRSHCVTANDQKFNARVDKCGQYVAEVGIQQCVPP